MEENTCLNCGTTEQERPLLMMKFQGKEIHICPQCLPVLIHKPHQLADKLPDFAPPADPAADDH